MTKINILFGTESGNAEMAAEDLCQSLLDEGIEASVLSMENADISLCKECDQIVFITSTYGEGELPETTEPFYKLLDQIRPDLSGVKFSGFGLGDSSYETYNNAILKFTDLLTELDATQVGEIGRHDASTNLDVSEVVIEWFNSNFLALDA